jgi:hypothetical protein
MTPGAFQSYDDVMEKNKTEFSNDVSIENPKFATVSIIQSLLSDETFIFFLPEIDFYWILKIIKQFLGIFNEMNLK